MDSLRAIAGDNKVEVYSVDEAFVDLSIVRTEELYDTAKYIKDTVELWTGISVSVGVAPTKTLAKLANNIAKKNKKASGCVTILATKQQQQEALQQTRLGDLWGIGRAYAQKLYDMGITNGWELATMPEAWVYNNMGGVVGARLLRELKGEPSITMKDELTEKKMIATTRMFGSPVSSLRDVKEAIATYTSRAAEKLRRQNSAARIVSVFVVKKEKGGLTGAAHDLPISTHITLPVATSVTQDLIKPALDLVDKIYERGNEYKKAGVMLGGLVADKAVQSNLFMAGSKNQDRRLMDTIDNVNFSQRNDILKFAASGTIRNWKMRQELRSSRYTTRWEELFEVS
jgi:DNA polymerase V